MSLNPIYLEFFVVCLGIALVLLESIRSGRNKVQFVWIAVIGLGVVMVSTLLCNPKVVIFSPFYTADRLAIFYKQFILLATILVLLMSLPYARIVEGRILSSGVQAGVGEFFILPLFACAGMMWLVSATDFIFLFIALELTTLSFYILVAYMRRDELCLEAGTKYFILGAFSTGFLVYGISWIFGVTGQTNFEQISRILRTIPPDVVPSLLFGLGLVLIAIGFKIAAFPFQFWVPDVYQGAPTPIAAYLSVASKASGFVVLLRVMETFFSAPVVQSKILGILGITAGLTVLFGNLAALLQTNMKRLLAYSSIAHAGFLLIGVASWEASLAVRAVSFYIGAYLLMTILAFFAMTIVSSETGGEEMSNFKGLGKRSPLLATSILLAMLSLAGIPFTAGFFGKFFIFMAAVQAHQWTLVVTGALGVCCGFYYYFKIIRIMYWQAPAPNVNRIGVTFVSAIVLVLLSVGIVALGVFPQPLISLFEGL